MSRPLRGRRELLEHYAERVRVWRDEGQRQCEEEADNRRYASANRELYLDLGDRIRALQARRLELWRQLTVEQRGGLEPPPGVVVRLHARRK